MKRILTIFIMIALCLFIACELTPPENNDPVDETKYGYVTPNSGKLGTKIKFFQMDSTDYPLDEYRILFTGMDQLVEPDSITAEGVFASVPFNAQHGPVKIVHYELDSTDFTQDGALIPMINHDTVHINYFDVTEYSSHVDTRLTWFDLNYDITPANSKYRSGKTVQEINWVGELQGDTTILTATYTIDGERFTHTLQFYSIRGNDILPELIRVYSTKEYSKFGVDYVDRGFFGEGVVKLQVWRPGELVSGRVITRLGNLNNFHFWCDFSE
jgi:hypothetical protein